jgi:hypothetical protein
MATARWRIKNLDSEKWDNNSTYHSNTANGTAGQVEGISRGKATVQGKGGRITKKSGGMRDVKDRKWEESERISNHSCDHKMADSLSLTLSL